MKIIQYILFLSLFLFSVLLCYPQTKIIEQLKQDISKAVSLTIQETGVSMVYTAIILFAGFAIFSASSFGGTAALGILYGLLFISCRYLVRK